MAPISTIRGFADAYIIGRAFLTVFLLVFCHVGCRADVFIRGLALLFRDIFIPGRGCKNVGILTDNLAGRNLHRATLLFVGCLAVLLVFGGTLIFISCIISGFITCGAFLALSFDAFLVIFRFVSSRALILIHSVALVVVCCIVFCKKIIKPIGLI